MSGRRKSRIKDTLNTIKWLWQKHPELRLMQLLLNCENEFGEIGGEQTYYIEDEDLVQRLIGRYSK